MKTNICTDINQSKRLLACGVDPKTADMSVRTIREPYGEDMAWCIPRLLTLPYDEARTIYGEDETTPAWSLSMLIELLPDSINRNDDSCYDLEFTKDSVAYRYYADMDCYLSEDEAISTYADSLIEACVQMIEWFLANGYSLNKIGE